LSLYARDHRAGAYRQHELRSHRTGQHMKDSCYDDPSLRHPAARWRPWACGLNTHDPTFAVFRSGRHWNRQRARQSWMQRCKTVAKRLPRNVGSKRQPA